MEIVTEEQRRFFDENGYLKYGRVLTEPQVEALREGLERIIEIEKQGGDDSSPEFKFGHVRGEDGKNDGGSYGRAIYQFVNMWKRDPAYREVIHDPTITGVARALLRSPRVRLWHDQVISKPPEDNGHFRFHQDFYFWPLREPNIVSCWLALDDAFVENGCMHVIPRSHKDPRFAPEVWWREKREREEAERRGQTIPETERQRMERAPASEGIPVELKAGECMFHHCLNFHATPQNITDRQRRALVMIFMADGVRVNLAQSPHHVLVPTFQVADGEVLEGDGFPLVGESDGESP